MTYAPFPEFELEALALENDEAAKRFQNAPSFSKLYGDRAAMLRNAVACHIALRDRCLTAEMDRNQIALKLESRDGLAAAS